MLSIKPKNVLEMLLGVIANFVTWRRRSPAAKSLETPSLAYASFDDATSADATVSADATTILTTYAIIPNACAMHIPSWRKPERVSSSQSHFQGLC